MTDVSFAAPLDLSEVPLPAAPAASPAPAANGLAIAALPLGIVGAMSGLVPLFFWFAFVAGLLGVLFGVLGRKRTKAGAPHRGLATWGLVTGIVALIMSAIGFGITMSAVRGVGNAFDKARMDTNSYTQCINSHPVEDWSAYCH